MSCFSVRYQPYTRQLSVSLGGAELTANPLSRFALLVGKDCAEWIWQFPQACAEALGTMKGLRVDFTGDAMCAAVLRGALPGAQVTDEREPAMFVTAAHRLRWAKELGKDAGCPFALTPLRCWRGMSAGTIPQPDAIAPGWPLRIRSVSEPEKADVLLASSEAEARGLLHRLPQSAGMRLLLVPGAAAFEVQAVERGGCLAACSAADSADVLRQWYMAFLLPAQIASFARMLETRGLPSGPEQRLMGEKLRMLTDDRPYLHLPLPAQLHAGDESHFIRPEKLPEDMKVVTRTDARYVAIRADKAIIPVAEGHCGFTLTPKDVRGVEQDAFRQEQMVEIIFPHPVTDVRLTASAVQLLVGDRFTVTPAYTPHNADNTAQARWSLSDPGVVARQPTGEFTACGVGRCTITHTVGTVAAQVTVEVKARATGIRLSRKLQEVKLSDTRQSIAASILPAGAGNGQLRFTVDPQCARVLDVDPVTGRITPRDEGTARITVELAGTGAARPVTRTCEVRIVPDQPVITPDATSVLAIVLMLLEGYFLPARLASVLMLAAVGVASYGLLAAPKRLTKVINVCLIALAVGLWLTATT